MPNRERMEIRIPCGSFVHIGLDETGNKISKFKIQGKIQKALNYSDKIASCLIFISLVALSLKFECKYGNLSSEDCSMTKVFEGLPLMVLAFYCFLKSHVATEGDYICVKDQHFFFSFGLLAQTVMDILAITTHGTQLTLVVFMLSRLLFIKGLWTEKSRPSTFISICSVCAALIFVDWMTRDYMTTCLTGDTSLARYYLGAIVAEIILQWKLLDMIVSKRNIRAAWLIYLGFFFTAIALLGNVKCIDLPRGLSAISEIIHFFGYLGVALALDGIP